MENIMFKIQDEHFVQAPIISCLSGHIFADILVIINVYFQLRNQEFHLIK